MLRREPPFTWKVVILVWNDIFSVVFIDSHSTIRLRQSLSIHKPEYEISEWLFTIGKSCWRSCEKLNSNWSNWNCWSFLRLALFEAAGRSRSTRVVFVQVNMSVCLRRKGLSCLPWGGGVYVGPAYRGKKERERETRETEGVERLPSHGWLVTEALMLRSARLH